MGRIVTCPLCNGKGTIVYYNCFTTASNEIEKICHGCGGKGWIEVSEQ